MTENSQDDSLPTDDTFIDKVRTKSFEIWVSTKEWSRRTGESIATWSKRTAHTIRVRTKEGLVWLDNHHAIQFLMAILISGIGIFLSLREFDIQQSQTIWMFVLIGIGIIGGTALWTYAAIKIFGKLLFYIVEHKYARKLVAGGSFSYYEYQGPDDYSATTRFTEPLSILITSLIAFLGLAATSIGIVRIFSSNLDTTSPILWGVLAILTPIFATPIIPISWILDDARVKAWNDKNQTTWMVSKRYKRRLNSFIAVSAVISNLRSGISVSSIVDELEILIGILRIGALIMFITLGFFIIFYYAWYRNYLRKIAFQHLDLKCYKVLLEEHEVTESMAFKQLKDLDIISDEEEDEDASDTREGDIQSKITRENEEISEDTERTRTENSSNGY